MKKLKKLIKEWLDIPECKEPDLSKYIRKYDIKKEIQVSLYEAFQPELPPERIYNANADYITINSNCLHGEFDRRVAALIEEDAKIAADKAIENIVYRESFIDDIVKRIKDKQL